MQILEEEALHHQLKPILVRIASTHIILFILLVGNALFLTENALSQIVQFILAFAVFLHHIDDRILKKNIFNVLQTLHDSQSYESALTESNNNAIIAIDPTRKILTYNKKAEEIFGYSKEEMLYKDNLELIMPNEYFKKHDKASKAFFETHISKGILNNTHDLFGKRKNGEIFPIRISFGVNDTNDIVIANISDISLEHKAKEAQFNLMYEIEQTQKEIISMLGNSIEGRDLCTKLHVDRVSLYCEKLALLHGEGAEFAHQIRLAAPLHDIGKVTISDSILNKPAKLTNEEFAVMKTHATAGYKILKHSKRELLQLAAVIAHEHHERWDGNGYPKGLQGDDISIAGRIAAIADVFDALSAKRVYKEAWPDEKVKKVMQEGMGTQFDPDLLKLFLEHFDQFIEVRDKLQN